MPGRQGIILIACDAEPNVELLASVQADDSYSVALRLPETLRRRAVEVMARMLREDGFVVSLTEGSRAALKRLGRTPTLGALLLDIGVPNEGHVQTMCCARSLNPGLPIFVLSTCRDCEKKLQAAVAGPAPVFFTKPVEYADLRLELGRVLRSHTGQMLRVAEPSSRLDSAANGDDEKR